MTGFGERRHLIGPDVDRTTHILDLIDVIDREDAAMRCIDYVMSQAG